MEKKDIFERRKVSLVKKGIYGMPDVSGISLEESKVMEDEKNV